MQPETVINLEIDQPVNVDIHYLVQIVGIDGRHE